jgi:predicted butyrate kinase (DUF1464 family)
VLGLVRDLDLDWEEGALIIVEEGDGEGWLVVVVKNGKACDQDGGASRAYVVVLDVELADAVEVKGVVREAVAHGAGLLLVVLVYGVEERIW